MTTPSIIAHRGASGVEVENSLAAFRRASALGADGIELDVHATADGALLVHHDAHVPGIGPIARRTAAELAAYRLPNGEPLPTLAAALTAGRGMDVWVEVKDLPAPLDDVLLETLRRGPEPARYAVHSFDHRIVARLHRREPALPVGVLSASYPVEPLKAAQEAGAAALWQEWHLIDAALVTEARAAGVRVIAWTVPDHAAAALSRLGVDGLCGNHPDRLRAATRS